MSLHLRQLALQLLCRLRQSPMRLPLLRFFNRVHNSSYHWLSFFSSGSGPHPKHAITNYHQFFLDHIKSSDQVIDLGCGLGELAADLAQKAALVTGIDLNPRSITQANQNFSRPNLHFMVGDITAPPTFTHFDVAVLSNVLEHIEHRVALLSAIQTFADKILIRVPLLTRDWITVYKQQHGLEYRLDHTHFIEYSTDSFLTEATAAGLTIVSWHIAYGELYAVCQSAPISSDRKHPPHSTLSNIPSPLVNSKQSSLP